MNVLVDHYFETKQTDPSISFFNFLKMHYVTDDNNSKDNNRDHQLPFKSGQNVIANSANQFVPDNSTLSIFSFVAIAKNDFFAKKESFITSNYQASIWRPPQVS